MINSNDLLRWHFFLGILLAPVLILVGFSGTLYAFEPQLRPIFEPIKFQASDCVPENYSEFVSRATEYAPEATVLGVGHKQRIGSVVVAIKRDDTRFELYLDPCTQALLGESQYKDGLLDWLLDFHRTLLAGDAGGYFVEFAVSWTLISVYIGLLLWLPRRKKSRREPIQRRRFWMWLHGKVGYIMLPLLVIAIVSGLFFTQVAGKVQLLGAHLAGQLPSVYASPVKLTDEQFADATQLAGNTLPIAIDTAWENHTARYQAAEFYLEVPQHPDEPIEISNNLGRNVEKLALAFYNPRNGEFLQGDSWDSLTPTCKLFMTWFPIHTGQILGLVGQILSALGGLAMTLLAVGGIVMWAKRRRRAYVELPPLKAPVAFAWMAVLLVFAPLAVVSYAVAAVVGRLYRLVVKASPAA